MLLCVWLSKQWGACEGFPTCLHLGNSPPTPILVFTEHSLALWHQITQKQPCGHEGPSEWGVSC